MPTSSYEGKETIEGLHKDAKFNLRQIISVLLYENRISKNVADMMLKEVSRIVDDALSMIHDHTGKTITYTLGSSDKQRYFELNLNPVEIFKGKS